MSLPLRRRTNARTHARSAPEYFQEKTAGCYVDGGVAARPRQKLPGINHAASSRADIRCRTRGLERRIASMKVTGNSGVGSLGSARGAARASGGQGGFALPTVGGANAASDVARSIGVSGVGSVSALIALQDVGGPLERRRRAVGRAGRILDVLDEVKLALIDGEVSGRDLDRLMRAVREERLATDDGALEGILNEIETRAAVELAKLEQARVAA